MTERERKIKDLEDKIKNLSGDIIDFENIKNSSGLTASQQGALSSMKMEIETLRDELNKLKSQKGL